MNSPRHPQTESEYRSFVESHGDNRDALSRFDFNNETTIREFKHWVIIKNRFPYDMVTKTNDMLVSKRVMQSMDEATDEERDEYQKIIKELSSEGCYDALIDNFPKTRSVTNHVHVHLVQWHTKDEH